MTTLTPERLATINTPCCGVPYDGVWCSKCRENYAHDLVLLDKFLSMKVEYAVPEGYVRDVYGYLHKEGQQVKRVIFKGAEEPEYYKPPVISTIQKRCKKCRMMKYLHQFYKGLGKLGTRSECRACSAVMSLDRKKK